MRRPSAAMLSFVTTTAAALATVAASAALLPETVPLHFGVGGAADRWSTRTGAVTFLASLSAALAALFALLAWTTRRVPWEWINVPGKQRWSELGRQDEVRRRLSRDMLWLGTVTALLDVAITLSTVEAARGGADRLPIWFFIAFVAWLVAIAGYMVYASLVRYRPPAEAHPSQQES